MKKTIALILALTLALCASGSALAYEKYDASIMNALELSSQQLTTSSNRSLAAALILLDYMFSADKDADFIGTLNASGSCRIAAYGTSSVDVYYAAAGGRYFNLFYSGSQITDYGSSSGPSSTSSYTYYTIPMTDVFESAMQILEIINNSGD